MKTEIRLNLRTREVYRLFERKINGDRLFMEAVLKKLNLIQTYSRRDSERGMALQIKVEQQLIEATQFFSSEILRFEQLLQKSKEFGQRIIQIHAQFHTQLVISNRLGILLFEFIETYDKLVALLKLTQLAGFYSSEKDYFFHLKKVQYHANRILSEVILVSIQRDICSK